MHHHLSITDRRPSSMSPSHNPSTTMAAPGPYRSTHLLPIPITSRPYGGSAQSPLNYWNSSLSENDTVCSVDWKEVTDSCCPWTIGIRSNTAQGCRMQATSENVAYFENCTRQIWGEITNRSQDAVPSCVPFRDKLRNQEEVATVQLQKANGYGLICGTVGVLERPFNVTGQ